MKLEVTWRETAERSSALEVPADMDNQQLSALARTHAETLAAAAGAGEVRAVAWSTDEPAGRVGATLP